LVQVTTYIFVDAVLHADSNVESSRSSILENIYQHFTLLSEINVFDHFSYGHFRWGEKCQEPFFKKTKVCGYHHWKYDAKLHQEICTLLLDHPLPLYIAVGSFIWRYLQVFFNLLEAKNIDCLFSLGVIHRE